MAYTGIDDFGKKYNQSNNDRWLIEHKTNFPQTGLVSEGILFFGLRLFLSPYGLNRL